MIEIAIPAGTSYRIEHLVFDYNGTLACDGRLDGEVPAKFKELAEKVSLHVVTADTFGLARGELDGLPCTLEILPPGGQVEGKKAFVETLGMQSVAAFGNGRNDEAMLASAAIGVALLRSEGASVLTVSAADIICTSIGDALDLFLHPKRLLATLRS